MDWLFHDDVTDQLCRSDDLEDLDGEASVERS